MHDQKSTSNKGRIAWVLLILSLLGNVYQWTNKTTVVKPYEAKQDSLTPPPVDLSKELTATYEELNKYKGTNLRLDSLLSEANLKLDEQKARIASIMKQEKNSIALNNKLTDELVELKKLRDQYLEKIDQLLVENESLKKQNVELSGTVDNIAKTLENTVNTASVLKSEYINIKTFKKKGSGKYTETAMAKRTNKMEVCFSVLENKIARKGEKNIYLCIIEPSGKTMGGTSTGSGTLKIAGINEEKMYSSSTKIDYKNEKQDVCLNWEEPERVYTSGTYTIEIFVDEMLSATSTYVLK